MSTDQRPASQPGTGHPGAGEAGTDLPGAQLRGIGQLVKPAGGGFPALLTYSVIADRRYLKVSLLSQLLAPIAYLLALGVGLGGVINHSGGASSLGTSYLSFIAPALVAATALQIGVGEATYPILHGGFKYQRTYFAMNATPLTSGQIAGWTLCWMTIKIAVSATSYLIIVACFGGWRSAGALLCIPLATIGALALTAPLAAYSATIRDEGSSFATIFRFVVMPMFLFSGTFYPISALPHWFRVLAWISPLWHATELSRWVALGPLHLSSGVGSLSPGLVVAHLLCLLVPAAIGVRLTLWRFDVRLTE
ncbi:MAG: ABC transporter permease [Jatrophihabitantaceae bacterium]